MPFEILQPPFRREIGCTLSTTCHAAFAQPIRVQHSREQHPLCDAVLQSKISVSTSIFRRTFFFSSNAGFCRGTQGRQASRQTAENAETHEQRRTSNPGCLPRHHTTTQYQQQNQQHQHHQQRKQQQQSTTQTAVHLRGSNGKHSNNHTTQGQLLESLHRRHTCRRIPTSLQITPGKRTLTLPCMSAAESGARRAQDRSLRPRVHAANDRSRSRREAHAHAHHAGAHALPPMRQRLRHRKAPRSFAHQL